LLCTPSSNFCKWACTLCAFLMCSTHSTQRHSLFNTILHPGETAEGDKKPSEWAVRILRCISTLMKIMYTFRHTIIIKLINTFRHTISTSAVSINDEKARRRKLWIIYIICVSQVLERLDTSDFHTQVPNMAMQYPFSLDVFQKEAVEMQVT
jgi:hypothetical protein